MGGRTHLARWLTGSGLELGPGHIPFEGVDRLQVTYVDRWKPDRIRELFPELPEDATYPEIDVFADFDADGLQAFADDSQDFVICSHVLEHLAAPLALMQEMDRVLRPGGMLILLLPDRRRTFDRYRASTSLEHLAREHRAGVRGVDDAHLFDFITLAEACEAFTRRPDGWTRDEFYAWHHDRSIHVHCWTEDEFDDVIEFCVTALNQAWEIVDRLPLDDDGFEFGYVLRKRPRSTWERTRGSIAAALVR
jgi:SAM-dependent methyltransferase